MPTPRYKSLPIEVEAVQLCWKNWNEVCDFLGANIINEDYPAEEVEDYADNCGEQGPNYLKLHIHIPGNPPGTGWVVRHGDYIIKNPVTGEFSVCGAQQFKEKYEAQEVSPPEEKCDRCGSVGTNRRSLWMSCAAEMDQLGIPFDEGKILGMFCAKTGESGAGFFREKHYEGLKDKDRPLVAWFFYRLRVCSRCRGEWMTALQEWFKATPQDIDQDSATLQGASSDVGD